MDQREIGSGLIDGCGGRGLERVLKAGMRTVVK